MAWLKNNWWALLLLAMVVFWYSLPAITGRLRHDPYWVSAPGHALRANLRQVSAIVLAVGAGLQLLMRVVITAAIHRLYLRGRSEPYQDASDRAAPLPERGASTLAALMALGFSRLGEIEGPVGIRKGQKTLHWLFADAEGRVRASVTSWKWMDAPGVMLRSDFADGATVMTYFPLGRNIRRPDLWMAVDKHSIEEAHRVHLAHVQGFQQGRGEPVQVTTVWQHLELDTEFDKRHGRTLWRSLQTPNLISLITLPLITAALLFFLLFMPRIAGPAFDLTYDAMGISSALLGGIVFSVIAIVEARRFLASL
jgi:hypothetical protein